MPFDRTSELIALALAALASCAWAAGPSAEAILERADEVRNPQSDYQIAVQVTNKRPDTKDTTGRYEVKLKGRNRSLIETLWPQIDKGKSMLMRDHEMFVFLPNVSQPVRISLQQRLFGAVSVGDVARADFAGDYEPTLNRVEKGAYVLDLKAKSDDMTYSRIRYWVRKSDYHPLKAEFYTASGVLLKHCAYEGYKQLAERVRPSKIVVTDALVKGQVSTIEISRMELATLQDKLFTKEHMKKLKY
jgi:outer membrane lipoprotein-sorting protein